MQRVIHVHSVKLPEIRPVQWSQPLQWLKAGWRDLTHSHLISLGYGAAFALGFSLLTIMLLNTKWYDSVMSLASGFVFVGPILAIGFFEISRRIERGEDFGLFTIIHAWQRNSGQILAMGLILMLMLLGWIRLTTLAYALTFEAAVPTWGAFIDSLLTLDGLLFLGTFIVTGFIVVAVVFAFTAVSLPMLLDRPEMDAISAVLISYELVRENMGPMFLWAAIIAALIGIALMTFYIGLILILPLLGHATWHAYRETIGKFEEQAD